MTINDDVVSDAEANADAESTTKAERSEAADAEADV
jgi:hypothetical protein